jgi:ubiquinone/menaquinone biosynthesis C-methylase UbiE
MSTRATQPELLEQRIRENRASQQIDLAAWIFERVEIKPDDSVLELCCGTGGQSLGILQALRNGHLTAVDISEKALATLAEKAAGNRAKLTTINASLDSLQEPLTKLGLHCPGFDLVFCAYGLYYALDARATLEEVKAWLKPRGRMAVAGPFGPNNQQLFDVVQASGVRLSEAVTSSSSSFMLETVLPWAAVNFETLRVSTLVNPVTWTNPQSVLNYWENTTFYEMGSRERFEALIQEHFKKCDTFVNEKWIMLVEMRDARV